MGKIAEKAYVLSKYSSKLKSCSRVILHLVRIAPVLERHAQFIYEVPFQPCAAVFFLASEIFPESVEDVIFFGTDQLIVDDLELHLEMAIHMGWNSDEKLFALPEERLKFSILPKKDREYYNTSGTGNKLTKDALCKDILVRPQHYQNLPEDDKEFHVGKFKDHHFLYGGLATGKYA